MQKKYCDGCGKHCPLSNPGCGYGIKKASGAAESGDYDMNETDRDHREDYDRGRGKDFEGRHGRRDGFDRGRGRREDFEGRHGHGDDFGRGRRPEAGRRRPSEFMEDHGNKDDLEFLVRECGRFLHQRGYGGPRGNMGSSQAQVLSILREKGSVSQRDLQYELGIQPGSVSELLSKLESKGLLARSVNEQDRRRVMLELTEEGRQTAPEKTEDRFAVLNDEEKETLRGLLQKVLESWR